MVDVKLLTKSGKEKNLHKKVFSSSYFIQNDGTKYIINNRTLIYIKGAIKSLIGFPQIIRKFVKKEDQKNWYYYLYIDRYLTKPLNKSKCVGNDMYEIKLLEIIWNLVDILIKTINSNKELYSNIIIWSFYNKEQDTLEEHPVKKLNHQFNYITYKKLEDGAEIKFKI